MLFVKQIAVADMAGVSTATVCRIVNSVSHIIASCAGDEVVFPVTQADRLASISNFYQIAAFPAVLGAIDCTHVAIQSPGGLRAELFRNRKGYFSLNIQAVVNASLIFINMVARWQGSAHDANIFAHSYVCARFETGDISGGFLLGDSGYPCKKYLLTPLAATPTVAQQRYNYAHIRTRNVVERAFGVLKRRFPCLRMGLRVKVKLPFLNVLVFEINCMNNV